MRIDREDMLELTRRMTPARHFFDRLAGGYLDGDGYLDNGFNIHFGKLSAGERNTHLEIAREIPFSRTNDQLTALEWPAAGRESREFALLLEGIRSCGLKNDALMETLYELIGAQYAPGSDYAVFVCHGRYDVPLKASDKERLWESEEVYDFLICSICLVDRDYTPQLPKWGFLYPAFTQRSTDLSHLLVYQKEPLSPLRFSFIH